MVIFPAFNPDRFLTWFYGWTNWMYTPWFTVLTLMVFALGLGISIAHWSEIGRDTIEFYNFTNKTWGDVIALYILGMFVVAVHEFGHAHACKHYGGRVPAMGFALVYLTPAFYTDTTEGAVKGSRHQRLIISLAGIWAELMICAVATPIWWGTPPDTLVHDGAYFLMMLTGFMSLIVNWNPLIKLDGYHMLCEVLGIPALKEDSTAFTAAWVKKYIWRLPVEVPYVPKRRRLGYAVYALASGAYSYTVLYVVARFAGNVFRNFNAEWSFVAELGVAALVFRSRIRLLVNFMKFVYLDKKDRVVAWFTPRRSAMVGAAILLLLALPLKRESVQGKFVLEAERSANVRARVSGVVTAIYAREGATVAAGSPLAELQNVPLRSETGRSEAGLLLAKERSNDGAVALRKCWGNTAGTGTNGSANAAAGGSLFPAGDFESNRRRRGYPAGRGSAGILRHRRDGNRRSRRPFHMKARIYISEWEVRKVQPDAPARIAVDGMLRKWSARVISVSTRPTEMDPRLLPENQLKGTNPPHFYFVQIVVPNADGRLKPGMLGEGRVYGERRSLGMMAIEGISSFFGRKIW